MDILKHGFFEFDQLIKKFDFNITCIILFYVYPKTCKILVDVGDEPFRQTLMTYLHKFQNDFKLFNKYPIVTEIDDIILNYIDNCLTIIRYNGNKGRRFNYKLKQFKVLKDFKWQVNFDHEFYWHCYTAYDNLKIFNEISNILNNICYDELKIKYFSKYLKKVTKFLNL